MAEKLCRVLARAAPLTLKPVGHQFTNHQLDTLPIVLMIEKNQKWLDTLPSFDGRKKWRKNFTGFWQQQQL
jgi:hypothetical protein